jgi:hypothetical protein
MHNPFMTRKDRELIKSMAALAVKESELNNLVAQEIISIRKEMLFQSLILALTYALFAFAIYKVFRS